MSHDAAAQIASRLADDMTYMLRQAKWVELLMKDQRTPS